MVDLLRGRVLYLGELQDDPAESRQHPGTPREQGAPGDAEREDPGDAVLPAGDALLHAELGVVVVPVLAKGVAQLHLVPVLEEQRDETLPVGQVQPVDAKLTESGLLEAAWEKGDIFSF